jgi:hypothetical protein
LQGFHVCHFLVGSDSDCTSPSVISLLLRNFVLVRRVGLEPTCLAAPAPKAGASTNSATLAAPLEAKKRV